MSQRRMFSPQIVDSDAFLDMSASAQCLYFHLGMRADDDGFVANPKKILRMVGGNEDDLKILLVKRFILDFESGVIVIKHWRINNLIRKDWYRPTVYSEEKNKLYIKENGAYTEVTNMLVNENSPTRPRRLGKDSIGKDNKEKSRNFVAPALLEVKSYCEERKNNVDAEQFINFYEAKGWLIGKTKMKDWRAAVRTWENRETKQKPKELTWRGQKARINFGTYQVFSNGSWLNLDPKYIKEIVEK